MCPHNRSGENASFRLKSNNNEKILLALRDGSIINSSRFYAITRVVCCTEQTACSLKQINCSEEQNTAVSRPYENDVFWFVSFYRLFKRLLYFSFGKKRT